MKGCTGPSLGHQGQTSRCRPQKATSPQPCCTRSQWKRQIKGGGPAQSGPAEEEEGRVLQAPAERPEAPQAVGT